MTKKQYAVVACAVLVLAGGLYYLLGGDSASSRQPVSEAGSAITDKLSYSGSSIIEEHDGKRFWELSAETIEVDPNTKNTTLKNITGTFYRDNGGKIIVTAPQGSIDGQTRDIVLDSQVKAVAEDGATFTAPTVRFNNAEKRYYGTGGVRVTRDDTVLTGDQLESDANMEKIKVSGHAHIIQGGKAQ